MNTSNNELPETAETRIPSAKTYLEVLMKMPLNRLLYEVLWVPNRRDDPALPTSTL